MLRPSFWNRGSGEQLVDLAAELLGGAVVCEQVFGLPGVGQAILNAINSKDAPIVMGATVILSLLYMVIMLVMDLLNALLNPKIRDNMG